MNELPVPARTLVTGATGFVGAAVARVLAGQGFPLRLMHRANANLSNLEGVDAERCVGDLNDPRSLELAVRGCTALFHVAADYRLWAPQPRELYRTNVAGTLALARAAEREGVHRMVYTSSVATLHASIDGRPANEDTPVQLESMIGHYKRSKFIAEQSLTEASSGFDMDVVIVNPSTPIGPRDIRPTPTGKIIVDAACGRIPAFVDTGLNVAHVDDVAAGHLLAFWQGERRRRYILGGDDMSLSAILREVALVRGRKPPTVRLPHAAVMPVAWVAEFVARWRDDGVEPLATVDGIRMARKRMYFSSRRAIDELGYTHRPGKLAIIDALRWFEARGYLD
jgi:dihydroflavonol-4-reductase